MNRRLGGRPTHEYIELVQTKETCRDTVHCRRTLTKLQRVYTALLNIKTTFKASHGRFYAKEAKTNNACLHNITTSANTNKPIDLHDLLQYVHFRRTQQNENMCVETYVNASGLIRPVQTAGMLHSTQDKQVAAKNDLKTERQPERMSPVCRVVFWSLCPDPLVDSSLHF